MNLEPLLPSDYPIWITYLAHQYDEALELAKTKSGLDPNNPWYHFDLSLVYGRTGRPTESVEEYLKFETLSGTETQTIARLRQAYEKSGPGGFWKRRLEEYRNAAKSQYVSNGMVAAACLRVGERECALESLGKAFHERDDIMINLNVDRFLMEFVPIRAFETSCAASASQMESLRPSKQAKQGQMY